jgi:hypothetical protein
MSIRQVSRDLAALAAVEAKVRPVPGPVLSIGRLFDAMTREFKEMNYQFRAPFVLGDRITRDTFGIEPTPYEESLRENLSFARTQVS